MDELTRVIEDELIAEQTGGLGTENTIYTEYGLAAPEVKEVKEVKVNNTDEVRSTLIGQGELHPPSFFFEVINNCA